MLRRLTSKLTARRSALATWLNWPKTKFSRQTARALRGSKHDKRVVETVETVETVEKLDLMAFLGIKSAFYPLKTDANIY